MTRPHIVVDNRMSRDSGIGVYLREIVPRLVQSHGDEFRLTLLGGEAVPGADYRPATSRIYSARELVEIPRLVPRGTDVLWSPNYNAPIVSRGRLLVTVHDTNHLALPDLLGSRLKAAYARMLFANVARRADKVICVSHFTAGELVRLTGIDERRIEVIHSAVDDSWHVLPDGPRPVAAPYVLYVGNVKPHKNLPRLLQAMQRLGGKVPHSIVIVGRHRELRTPDRSVAAAAAPLGSRVVFTGELTHEQLRLYYRHADLLAFPSLYEGFGFPPLEAMAMGVPVAAARAASIPEVCGDAVAYFDPCSVEDMSGVIERTLSDEDLRERLRQSGRRQVARYSWDATTARVAAVLRSTLG
jgi:glycosyltransferase involved in cell wall biosynthesis